MNNVIVTHGANGALNAFINAFCNKGDEAVTFGPLFPVYIDLAVEMNYHWTTGPVF